MEKKLATLQGHQLDKEDPHPQAQARIQDTQEVNILLMEALLPAEKEDTHMEEAHQEQEAHLHQVHQVALPTALKLVAHPHMEDPMDLEVRTPHHLIEPWDTLDQVVRHHPMEVAHQHMEAHYPTEDRHHMEFPLLMAAHPHMEAHLQALLHQQAPLALQEAHPIDHPQIYKSCRTP